MLDTYTTGRHMTREKSLLNELCHVSGYRVSLDRLRHALSRDDGLLVVAKRGGWVIGYILCDGTRQVARICDLQVLAICRRKGVGAKLVSYLIGNMAGLEQGRITALVPDDNLTAQLFFRSQGFRCEYIYADAFGEGMAGYSMQFRVGREPAKPAKMLSRNFWTWSGWRYCT